MALLAVLTSRFLEFRSYLAVFSRLWEAEVRDSLKQVDLNKSPGLTGLPYEVYLRLLHMFVTYSDGRVQLLVHSRTHPGRVTKGMITLLKKGGRHRPITQLNTELKILDPVLKNRLQLVISNLIRPGHNDCEGKINSRQLALGAQGPKGVKRRY